MNATMTGKILVFANLVLSLLFATMALGLYTNRIDWPGSTTPGEKVLGEHEQRKAQIKEQEQVASAALTRWYDMSKRVNDLEAERPAANALYEAKLKTLDQGPKDAVKALARNKDGTLVEVRNQGRLVNLKDGDPVAGPVPNQFLQSRSIYQTELQTTAAAIQRQTQVIRNAQAEAEDLTVRINGLMGTQKGLRDLLREEETAQRNALNEWDYLRPLRYNRQAEAELLAKRQAALEARVEELQKALGKGGE